MDICTSYLSCSIMSSCETISQESSSSPEFNNSQPRNNSKFSEPTLASNITGTSPHAIFASRANNIEKRFFYFPEESEILTVGSRHIKVLGRLIFMNPQTQ